MEVHPVALGAAAALAVLGVGVAIGLLTAYRRRLLRRTDRLHDRVDGAAALLDRRLRDRAAAAVDLARRLDATTLGVAARAARDVPPGMPGEDRIAVENVLSGALRAVAAGRAIPRPVAAVDLEAVRVAARRVALARQVHIDAVRDTRALRERWPARALRVIRDRPPPAYVDFDTGVDGGLDAGVDTVPGAVRPVLSAGRPPGPRR